MLCDSNEGANKEYFLKNKFKKYNQQIQITVKLKSEGRKENKIYLNNVYSEVIADQCITLSMSC